MSVQLGWSGSWPEAPQPLLWLAESWVRGTPVPAPTGAAYLCTWRSPGRFQLTHVTVTGCVLYCSLDLEKTESANGGPVCERFLFLRRLTSHQHPGSKAGQKKKATPPEVRVAPGLSRPPQHPAWLRRERGAVISGPALSVGKEGWIRSLQAP